MPESVPPVFLATAIEAVMRAGQIQMDRFGRDIQVDKKGAIDLVTEIDLEVERGFRAMIAERFPDHAVLGEEYSAATESDTVPGYCWVFDPIDGTTNYAHGLPIFCSSLALEIDGEGVVAAVYDPTRRELFTAERGAGAWLNGVPLRVSSAETLIDSLLVTGFHYNVQRDPAEVVGLFSAFITKARAVRRLGSAALDLCYVAAGRVDGFWEQKLQPWDVAGGALIVAEAGGQVTTTRGTPYQSRGASVLASNGRIHAEMLTTIQAFQVAFRSRNWTE
ncbi:MAG: inositol monophosphatase [Acidobacteria bacterium]|nr:inositol monophosphatase [Acidobacteriota bacterium]MCA1649079.1 inositol monophosphatase [Acidobacteriota bacterium]